jgi:hypothetical protein
MNLVRDIYPTAENDIKTAFPLANVELFHDTDTGCYEVHVYHSEVSTEVSTKLDALHDRYWQLFTIIQIPRSKVA